MPAFFGLHRRCTHMRSPIVELCLWSVITSSLPLQYTDSVAGKYHSGVDSIPANILDALWKLCEDQESSDVRCFASAVLLSHHATRAEADASAPTSSFATFSRPAPAVNILPDVAASTPDI